MKIKFLILTLFTLVLCAEPPKLYRVPLTRIERTTTEKKQLFEFLTTHQNYFIDEDDPELQELLNWQPPSYPEVDNNYESEQKKQQVQQERVQEKVERVVEQSKEKVTNEEQDQQVQQQQEQQQQQQGRLRPSGNRAQKSLIHLQNFKNTQYLGEIKVGSQQESFTVIYDTGSANMWLNSKRCNDPGCLNHRQFDPFNSKSYSETGFDLDVQFGTGGLKGFMGQDQVELGGVPVDKQDFAEIVKEEGAVFEASKFDGIVGLAYPSMAAYDLNPVFDNVIKQKKLSSNIFTFMLDRSEGGSSSELILGGYDESQIEGEMKWHKVVDQYYWMIQAEKILLDGKDTGLCNNCNVIADTGTSLITGPMNELMTLLNSIQVDDDCSNAAQAPTLTFVIDGIHYDLTPHDYMMKVDDDDNEEPYSINMQMETKKNMGFLSLTETKSSQKCTGAFMPLDIPEPQGPAWILGDIFLSKYVSAYDRDRNMVGFAKSKKVK